MARPGKSIAKQSEGRAGEKYLPVGGRVRKLRSVGDQAGHPLGEGQASLEEAFISFDSRKENAFGLLMSLNMLIETHGGFDFTGADCRKWMKDVGFKRTRVERLAGPDGMVVGFKQG